MEKSPEAFRTISEVADDLEVPQHVLRFWEGKFNQVKPMKRAGGRRYYRPADVELLRGIRHLLYGEGYTIKGVQRILREQGTAYVVEAGRVRSLPVASQPDQAEAQPKPVPVPREPAASQHSSNAEEPAPAAPVSSTSAPAAAVSPAAPGPAVREGMSDADKLALGNILKELRAVRDLLTTVRPG